MQKTYHIRQVILLTVTLTFILAVWAITQQAFAAGWEPVRISVPVTYTVTGGTGAADPGVFYLRAKTAGAPMPERSVNGVCTLNPEGSGTWYFGAIAFDKPNIWEYTVSREAGEEDGVERDRSVYNVRIIVLENGEGSIIVTGQNAGEKKELKYNDRIHSTALPEEKAEKPRSHGSAVQTGDPFGVGFAGILFAVSALGIGLLLRGRKKNRAKTTVIRTLLCMLLMMTISAAAPTDSCGATMGVKLHSQGTCNKAGCSAKRGDDKNDWKTIGYDLNSAGKAIGITTYRWVSYTDPVTGKQEKADAYCIEPSKSAPDYGARKATFINTATAKGKWRSIAKLLYFADGGPGYAKLASYLKDHESKYPKFQTRKQRFALTHMMLAYAFDPDEAFKVTSNCGVPSLSDHGYHTKAYQKKVLEVYRWCLSNAEFVDNASFSISPATGKADYDAALKKYRSVEFNVTGVDQRQYFRYKVPSKTTMRVTHGGKTSVIAAGKTAEVHVGDTFSFTFDADKGSGISKKKVTGELSRLMPYDIKSSGGQDIGFFAASKTDSASFAVSLNTPDTGKVRVQKQKKTLDGKVSAEAGVTFRIWKDTYAGYEAAESAGTGGPLRYADEITTDADGTALTRDLAVGTYYAQQMNSTKGFAMMSPNPQKVAVTKGTTSQLGGGLVTDREIGIHIRIRKVDGKTQQPITSSAARFGIYSDSACTRQVASAVTAVTGSEAGTALSAGLSPGTYYIKELEAPEGYRCSEEADRVQLAYTTGRDNVYSYTKKNYQKEYHDVQVKKTVSEGNINQTFGFRVELSGITEADGVSITSAVSGGTESEVPFVISGGKAAVSLRIRDGGSFSIKHMPVGTEYKISEEAAEGYRQSFQANPAGAVKSASDSGDPGEGLLVRETVQPEESVGEDGYTTVYRWDNSQRVLHSLLLSKTSIGIERDDEDAFAFRVDFSGLTGILPGYTIWGSDGKGGREVISSRARRESANPSVSYDIVLRTGQKVKFTDITPNAKYVVTEEASEYAPSYRVVTAAGVIAARQGSAGANESLSTGVNTMPDNTESKQAAFEFVNTAQVSPTVNSLKVTKTLTTGDASRSFDFAIRLDGLEKNGRYALMTDGTQTYTLRASIAGARVTDQNGRGIAGISLALTRSDGKRKILRTGADGAADFSSLEKWIRQKQGSSVLISWTGGEITAGAGQQTSTASGLKITSFTADSKGKAGPAFALKTGQSAWIDGLPDGAGYTVTEVGNTYEPSYAVYRDRNGGSRRLDADAGGTKTDLTTDRQVFPEGGGCSDRVHFTNSTQTRTLKVTKTVTEGTRTFPFRALFSGLTRDRYFAVIPGKASAKITSDAGGNITVTVSNSAFFNANGGDLSGLPVKIIRADGQNLSLYTNAAGKIAGSSYIDWLMTVTTSHRYTVEFLKNTFEAEW